MLNSKKDVKKFWRDVLMGLGMLSLIIVGALSYTAMHAERTLSQSHIDHVSKGAKSAYMALAVKMEKALKIVSEYAEKGMLDWDNIQQTQSLLTPILNHNETLSGISVVDTDGRSVYLRLEEGRLRTRKNSRGVDGRTQVVQFWKDGKLVEETEPEASDYDARSREWFSAALTASGVAWSLPYTFYDRNVTGVTLAIAGKEDINGRRIVVAFDILQDDLFLRIQAMAPSDNSRIMLFVQNNAKLYHQGRDGDSAIFMSMKEAKDPLVQAAYNAWYSEPHHQNGILSLQYQGETWWCGFRPLGNETRNVWMGVIVPSRDINDGLRYSHWRILSLGIVILLGAMLPLLWIARRYLRPSSTEIAFDISDPQGSVHKLIEGGEGTTVEFKSTMRMNLHSKKPGKEIEIAWLKGVAAFLNTEGGVLLLGVTDDGDITGLERDVFENEDKCLLHFKNLVAAHIGAEFSRYIQFSIQHVDDRQVGVVLCERSKEPVFLKHPKGEGFFIRNGPSSDELPGSRVMDYIKRRR